MIRVEDLPAETKDKIVKIWKTMNESNKMHFINQMALALSVWGSDENGKKKVLEVIDAMVSDGSETLSDFGLYISKGVKSIGDKEKRANRIIEDYRLKYDLPTFPTKPLI